MARPLVAALHVVATVVLIPYLVLAAGFLILGHAISRGSWLAFFDTLIMHAAWLVPWGILASGAAMTIIAILGLTRLRGLGALCLGVLAADSLAVILIVDRSRIDAGALLFLLPCGLVLLFGLWAGWAERRARVP